MEIQVVYCYVAVDIEGKESLMGVEMGVTKEGTPIITPMIALNKETINLMEPAAREIANKDGISYRLKIFSSPEILIEYKGYS